MGSRVEDTADKESIRLKMKLLVVTCLVGALIGQTLALECYNCVSRTEEQECHNKEICQPNQHWCTKIKREHRDVTRQCSSDSNTGTRGAGSVWRRAVSCSATARQAS